MRYLTTLCIVSIAMLSCPYSNGQSDPPTEKDKIDALLVETQRLIKAKPPAKDFMIGWKTRDGAVTQILLMPPKPLLKRTVEDFHGLKVGITRLPKGASVSYTFSDFRPDLLTHKQIIELSDHCKKNEVAFYLHAGG